MKARIKQREYNEYGQIVMEALTNGSSFHFTYDDNGNLIKEAHYGKNFEPMITEFKYKNNILVNEKNNRGREKVYDNKGNIVLEIDGKTITQYKNQYDKLGRLVSVDSENYHKHITYDSKDNALYFTKLDNLNEVYFGKENKNGLIYEKTISLYYDEDSVIEEFNDYDKEGRVVYYKKYGKETMYKYDDLYTYELGKIEKAVVVTGIKDKNGRYVYCRYFGFEEYYTYDQFGNHETTISIYKDGTVDKWVSKWAKNKKKGK